MEIFQAIILGIVEGFTEFLPISSTGHLIIAEDLINFKDTAELFTVVIQIGAIAAVVWFYRIDIARKITGLFGRQKTAVRFWTNLVIATVPAGLAGLALDETLQKYAVPRTVAWSLIAGGVVLWLVETFHKGAKTKGKGADLDSINAKQALGVGLTQIVSLIPGVSRSGSTIVGGLLTGLNRTTATAFSFYLSIPVMILASGYKIVKEHEAIGRLPGGAPALVVGIAASFITGLVAVSWLLKFVSTHSFKPFAYYRLVFGVLILVLLAAGTIS